MIERRKHKRSKSHYPLPVMDRNTGEQLGILIDLSLSGLLMRTMRTVRINSTYPLQIIFPLTIGKSNNIEFSAKIVWIDSLEQKGLYAGLSFIDVSDDALDRIRQLVDLWSLEGTVHIGS